MSQPPLPPPKWARLMFSLIIVFSSCNAIFQRSLHHQEMWTRLMLSSASTPSESFYQDLVFCYGKFFGKIQVCLTIKFLSQYDEFAQP